MKRIFAISLIMMMLTPSVLYAEDKQYELGAYYQMGKYNDSPIIWRCIDMGDENGFLMVSDKILCFKSANSGEKQYTYGDGFWEESTIRTWLNSTENAGDIQWIKYPPNFEHLNIDLGYSINYPYSDEQGFLNDNNFSRSEKNIMKTVSQWQALPNDKVNLSTNGYTKPYLTEYSVTVNARGENETLGRIDLDELTESYKGAMYRISDTVFLLNEPQLHAVYNQLGTIGAEVLQIPISKSGQIYAFWHDVNEYDYWLRSPGNRNKAAFNAVYSEKAVVKAHSCAELGIRPAFYLNEDTAYIKSGSGTSDDPYILDGTVQEEIPVFVNGKQIKFNQPPVLENDYTLVGMRAIFEVLGAEVEWNGSDKTVIATKDDTTIQLQIDNNTMQKDGVAIELGTPARLINDNTMVPIRAVSEALDTKVDWIANLERIVIDKQPEWIESEWSPEWYKQAMLAGGYVE